MKSREDFTTVEAYKLYLKIETAKSAVCVLLSKDSWKDYKTMCKEAHKIGEAFTSTLNIKK